MVLIMGDHHFANNNITEQTQTEGLGIRGHLGSLLFRSKGTKRAVKFLECDLTVVERTGLESLCSGTIVCSLPLHVTPAQGKYSRAFQRSFFWHQVCKQQRKQLRQNFWDTRQVSLGKIYLLFLPAQAHELKKIKDRVPRDLSVSGADSAWAGSGGSVGCGLGVSLRQHHLGVALGRSHCRPDTALCIQTFESHMPQEAAFKQKLSL